MVITCRTFLVQSGEVTFWGKKKFTQVYTVYTGLPLDVKLDTSSLSFSFCQFQLVIVTVILSLTFAPTPNVRQSTIILTHLGYVCCNPVYAGRIRRRRGPGHLLEVSCLQSSGGIGAEGKAGVSGRTAWGAGGLPSPMAMRSASRRSLVLWANRHWSISLWSIWQWISRR